MIGNDIVDLQWANKRSRSLEKRYWEKILTQHESDLYLGGRIEHELLWVIWGLKESAYKLERRFGRSRLFCPKDYTVDLEAERVRGKQELLRGSWIQTKNFVHVTCWRPSASQPGYWIDYWNAPLPAFTRLWTWKKEENGALSAFIQNSSQGLSVSKSHHGRYLAYAWLPIVNPHDPIQAI